jgi:hypothetical protein
MGDNEVDMSKWVSTAAELLVWRTGDRGSTIDYHPTSCKNVLRSSVKKGARCTDARLITWWYLS